MSQVPLSSWQTGRVGRSRLVALTILAKPRVHEASQKNQVPHEHIRENAVNAQRRSTMNSGYRRGEDSAEIRSHKQCSKHATRQSQVGMTDNEYD